MGSAVEEERAKLTVASSLRRSMKLACKGFKESGAAAAMEGKHAANEE